MRAGVGVGVEGRVVTVELVLFAGVYFLPNSPVMVSQHGFSRIFVGICALASRVCYITSLSDGRKMGLTL